MTDIPFDVERKDCDLPTGDEAIYLTALFGPRTYNIPRLNAQVTRDKYEAFFSQAMPILFKAIDIKALEELEAKEGESLDNSL